MHCCFAICILLYMYTNTYVYTYTHIHIYTYTCWRAPRALSIDRGMDRFFCVTNYLVGAGVCLMVYSTPAGLSLVVQHIASQREFVRSGSVETQNAIGLCLHLFDSCCMDWKHLSMYQSLFSTTMFYPSTYPSIHLSINDLLASCLVASCPLALVTMFYPHLPIYPSIHQ